MIQKPKMGIPVKGRLPDSAQSPLFNSVIIVLLVTYAYGLAIPLREIILLILAAVLTSIPVALPAAFTLAAAIGAKALAKVGVLPTRLSAVDEASTMDVLCVDKTGTLKFPAMNLRSASTLGSIW